VLVHCFVYGFGARFARTFVLFTPRSLRDPRDPRPVADGSLSEPTLVCLCPASRGDSALKIACRICALRCGLLWTATQLSNFRNILWATIPRPRRRPMSANDTRFADPFEDKLKEIASALPPEKLKRLIDILQRYQGTPPEQLPPDILRELNAIIDIGEGRSSPREERTTRQRDTAASPLRSPTSVSTNESDNYFARLPDSEKLRIVEQVMNRPDCTIPKEVIPNMPDEMNLFLFDKLVEEGVIKWEKAGG
jgi:hypothetical protein